MGLEYKEACMQLEKAFDLLTRTKVKTAYIDQNYDKIFDNPEDYQAIRQYYTIETKYATMRCAQIIDSDEKLSEQRGHHSVYNKFYNSRDLIFTVSFVMLPLLLGAMIYSYLIGINLIFLFASLILICIGCLGMLYDRNSISTDYYGPNRMQLRVLKRVNYDLRSGKLLEEILNDIKIQLAKKDIGKVINTDLEDTHIYPIFDEIGFKSRESASVNINNVISTNEEKEEKRAFKQREKEKKVKASVSGIADKYADEWSTNKAAKAEARKNKGKQAEEEVVEEKPEVVEEVKEAPAKKEKKAKKINASDSSIAAYYSSEWKKNKKDKRDVRLGKKKPEVKEEVKAEEPKKEKVTKPATAKVEHKKRVYKNKRTNASVSSVAANYAKEWKVNKEKKRIARLAKRGQ